MGPSFAETSGRFTWLLGTLVASAFVLVALRPCPPAAARPRPASFEKFDHYKPVKKCIEGRWVIARERARR